MLIRGQLLGAFRLDFFDGFDFKKNYKYSETQKTVEKSRMTRIVQ